jgi:hypothetical protein
MGISVVRINNWIERLQSRAVVQTVTGDRWG